MDPKCNHKYPYEREAEVDLTTEKKEGKALIEARRENVR